MNTTDVGIAVASPRVGKFAPEILDALPKERGMSKDEIVDELLKHATERVDNAIC